METLKEASCVIPHSERHQFPSPRKKGPDAWHLFQCNPELPSYANVNRVFFPLGINGKITEAGLKSHFKMYPIF